MIGTGVSNRRLISAIDKVLDRLDADNFSLRKFENELSEAFNSLEEQNIARFSIIFVYFLKDCSQQKLPKKISRYEAISHIFKTIIANSGNFSLVLIKTSFQLAFHLCQQREEETAAVKKQLKQASTRKSYNITLNSIFTLMTTVLLLNLEEQLIFTTALSRCEIIFLKELGKQSLSVLFRRVAIKIKDTTYLESIEEFDISNLPLPTVQNEFNSKFNTDFFKLFIFSYEDMNLTPVLLKYFLCSEDETKLEEHRQDSILVDDFNDDVVFDIPLKYLEKPSRERLVKTITENPPSKATTAKEVAEYLNSVGCSSLKEEQIAQLVIGILQTVNKTKKVDIPEDVFSPLETSFELLTKTKEEFDRVNLEDTSVKAKVTTSGDLWQPEIFVKAVIKMKRESGLLNIQKCILNLDGSEEVSINEGIEWLFIVLSELNVKDKKVNIEEIFGRKWKSVSLQTKLISFIISEVSKEEPAINFSLRNHKGISVLEQKDLTGLILNLSTWGSYINSKHLFLQYLQNFPMAVVKTLPQLISKTDYIEPNENGEYDIFTTRIGDRFLPLKWEMLGTMISNALREKNFDLLRKCWAVGGKEFILKFLYRKYLEKRSSLVMILTLLKASPDAIKYISSLKLVSEKTSHFVFDFVSNAFSIEADTETHLSLKNWLKSKVFALKTPEERKIFFRQATQFVLKAFGSNVSSPSIEKLAKFFVTQLLEYIGKFPKEEIVSNDIKEICTHLLQLKKNLDANQFQNSQKTKAYNTQPQSQATTPNIEAAERRARECLSGFMQKKRSLNDVVLTVKHFKSSSIAQERKVYDIFIQLLNSVLKSTNGLTDEDSKMLGVLLGVLIKVELIVDKSLQIILKSINQALTSSPTLNRFKMGLCAVDKFKVNLPLMPEFAKALVNNSNLRVERPELIREILIISKKNNSENKEKSNAPEASDVAGASKEEISYIVRKLNIELRNTFHYPLRGSEDPEQFLQLCEKIDTIIPSEGDVKQEQQSENSEGRDKIQFVINNLTKSNLEEKCNIARGELKKDKELTSWFAKYLVVNIVSRQANFHEVYAKFLESLDDTALLSDVVNQTLLSLKDKLKSQLLVGSSGERTVLKNLGAWLGLITIAKSVPLLKKQLDLKELLVDGYERGWLIAILPFAVKLLCSVPEPKATPAPDYDFNIFTKNNPWMQRMLMLIAEVYQLKDLKLNLKFEIEVACNTLGCKLKDVKPSTVLVQRKKPLLEGNPDFNIKDVAKLNMRHRTQEEQLLQTRSHIKIKLARIYKDTNYEGAQPEQAPVSKPVQTPTQSLSTYVVFPKNRLLSEIPGLKSVLVKGIEISVREILKLYGERSCTVGCITSRQMVRKDFPLECDEEKIKNLAQRMVTRLSVSLIRAAANQHLPNIFDSLLSKMVEKALSQVQDVIIDPHEASQCISEFKAANFDLTLRLIDKATAEKVSKDIIKVIDPIIKARQLHRSQTGTPLIDTNNYQTSLQLPSILRPTPQPNGIDNYFLQVYADFTTSARKPRSAPQNREQVDGSFSLAQAAEEWKKIISRIDRLVQDCMQSESIPHPLYAEVIKLIQKVGEIGKLLETTGVKNKNQAAALFAQRMFRRVFIAGAQNASQAEKFRAQVQIGLLQAFVALSDELQIRRKMSEWVFAARFENKPNRIVVTGLLRSKILDFKSFDICLAKILDKEPTHQPYVSFAEEIIKICVLSKKFMKVQDLIHTIETLHQIDLKQKRTETLSFPSLSGLLNELQNQIRRDAGEANLKKIPKLGKISEERIKLAEIKKDHQAGLFLRSNEPSILRKQVAKFLHAWMNLYVVDQNEEVEKIFIPGPHQAQYQAFLTSLQQHRALAGEDNTDRFFKLCAELVIESALTNTRISLSAEQPMILSYAATDAFGKLVLLLVKYAKIQAKARLVSKILNIIAEIFLREVNNRTDKNIAETIDQRPYFRLYINLLKDLDKLYEKERKNLGDKWMMQIVQHFYEILHLRLSPTVAPGFAFAWLRIFSHPSMFGTLVKGLETDEESKCGVMLCVLFKDLFTFLRQAVKDGEDFEKVPLSVKQIYFGALKMLVVLYHDNPAFLAKNYLKFLSFAPHSWSQIRNIILAGSPKIETKTPNESCFECDSNNLSTEVSAVKFEKSTDLYIILKQAIVNPNTDLNNIVSLLNIGPMVVSTESKYDVLLIGDMVYFLGITLAQSYKTQTNKTVQEFVEASNISTVFLNLIQTFDDEANAFLLSSIVDHLRYSSLETAVFSCILGKIFTDTPGKKIQEQVTRTLLQRLIVHKPHPYGLLSFFIQLVYNKKFDFWKSTFFNDPDVLKLLKSVSNTLMTSVEQKNKQEKSAKIS